MPGFDERGLIERMRRGDESGFNSLIAHYMQKSYGLAFRMMGNDSDTREMIQEACIKAYKKLHQFDLDCPFGPWFLRIVVNTCLNQLKRNRLRIFFSLSDPESIDIESFEQKSAEVANPEEQVIANERVRIIEKALLKVPLKQRAALILYDMEGYNQKEVADILGCPVGSVMSRVYYGRKRLKNILQKYFV